MGVERKLARSIPSSHQHEMRGVLSRESTRGSYQPVLIHSHALYSLTTNCIRAFDHLPVVSANLLRVFDRFET
jgi:hypothetical protein